MAGVSAYAVVSREAKPCFEPLLFLNKDGQALTDAFDVFLEENLPGPEPVYESERLASTVWTPLEMVETNPDRVVMVVLVSDQTSVDSGVLLDVVMLRDCRDSGWRVAVVEPVPFTGSTPGPPSSD